MNFNNLQKIKEIVEKEPNNSDAWYNLGLAQTESDDDDEAIKSLIEAIRLDQNNAKAKVALSNCYSNDFENEKALSVLTYYIRNEPNYKEFLDFGELDKSVGRGDDISEIYYFVLDLFLKASSIRSNSTPDPNIQSALAVLYIQMNDYSNAADCFRVAIKVDSMNYRLWSKLGATLTNSGQHYEAINAYKTAIELNPSYVRAKHNLGISYYSIGMYTESAQELLGALVINPEAHKIWSTLETLFSVMDRTDLQLKLHRRNVNDFIGDFKFK